MTALFALDRVTVTRPTGNGSASSVQQSVQPLRDVTAAVRPGACTAVVGPSGAGKSTLLRLLDRLEEPSAGQVLFHGRPLPSYDVLALRRRVGLLQQQPVLLGRTVREDVTSARPALADAEVIDLLARADLAPDFLGRETRTLSGGEAQRVCLARALSVGPEVLLADEPTASLDAFAAATVERTLRGLVDDGLTTVLVTHDLGQARRIADDLLVVVAGSVVAQGPAAEVFAETSDSRARAFLAGVT